MSTIQFNIRHTTVSQMNLCNYDIPHAATRNQYIKQESDIVEGLICYQDVRYIIIRTTKTFFMENVGQNESTSQHCILKICTSGCV